MFNDLYSLKGKRAWVCGSSQGIGLASAQALAIAGAEVTLLARNRDRLIQVLETLNVDAGQQHSIIVSDFSQATALEQAIVNHQSDIENKPIHILVNNSGGPKPGPAHLAKSIDFVAAFEQHLLCNHILMQHLLPGMKTSGYGRIINIISTSVKAPLPNLGVSNTIRAAVANWSKTLSRELAPYGITVNNVLPGATLTSRLTGIISDKAGKLKLDEDEVRQEMLSEIPAGRFGTADEIAAAVLFLASPLAGYINGINIPVDGGRTASL
ncbi:MAG: SDR family oxidoreductase [Bacteroidota bacterium]|nr:SDR family oxidoreductase [Bacteroidota bacterium]